MPGILNLFGVGSKNQYSRESGFDGTHAVHRALRVQAALHGHSTEAEVREILANAVKPEARVRVGDALAALGRKVGLTNKDFEVLERAKDKKPAEPMRFD